MVPVSVCGTRCAPCPRWGCVAHRPRHTKLPCCICHRQRRAARARLSPPVRARPKQKINPIVNVSFTMGFIGAGDRTRTGTLSLAVDFESTTSTNSITPACVSLFANYNVLEKALSLITSSCCGARRMSSTLKSLRPSSTAATRSGRFIRPRRRSLRSPIPSHRQVLEYYTTTF